MQAWAFVDQPCGVSVDRDAAPWPLCSFVVLATTEYDEGVARADVNSLSDRDCLELAAVHRLVKGHIGDASESRYVKEDAASDDAVRPRLNSSEARARKADLIIRPTSVPHTVAIPNMAQRVYVSGLESMSPDSEEVERGAALTALNARHEVLRGMRVLARRCHGQRKTQ